MYLPGSANAGPDDREPASAADRGDGAHRRCGVYLAYGPGYPTRRRVNLLRFGGQPQMVGRGNTIENVNVAPAPEGRLWIMSSDPRAAERSTEHPRRAEADQAATRVGPVTLIAPPSGTVTVFGVHGEG